MTQNTPAIAAPIVAPVTTSLYEAALVFAMPPRAHDLVIALRQDLNIPAPAEHQLRPHVTVLFLGAVPGSRLTDYLHVLHAELDEASATCTLNGTGAFLKEGRVMNLHLRLADAQSLSDLQMHAVNLLTKHDWQPSTPYLGERYVPHVSIFDRVHADPAILQHRLLANLPRWPVALDSLHVMGKVLADTIV